MAARPIEGVLFAEISGLDSSVTNNNPRGIGISDGANGFTNHVSIYFLEGLIYARAHFGGLQVYIKSVNVDISQNHKVAFKYKENDSDVDCPDDVYEWMYS
mgnify:CR=1 FL=1